mmetsp:Transcript_41786/g.90659  ORF Transcript_41786/g.90659 Transcript_41786/m.90659 type:complete len:117 (+) Transcript_41786:109-459(+)
MAQLDKATLTDATDGLFGCGWLNKVDARDGGGVMKSEDAAEVVYRLVEGGVARGARRDGGGVDEMREFGCPSAEEAMDPGRWSVVSLTVVAVMGVLECHESIIELFSDDLSRLRRI